MQQSFPSSVPWYPIQYLTMADNRYRRISYLTSRQNTFRCKRSACWQLVPLLHQWKKNIKNFEIISKRIRFEMKLLTYIWSSKQQQQPQLRQTSALLSDTSISISISQKHSNIWTNVKFSLHFQRCRLCCRGKTIW